MITSTKVAVISGGMGSVGRAVVTTLAQEGYRVVVLYRNSKKEDISAVRRSLPGEHLFIRCDVRNVEDMRRMVDDIMSSIGQIDVAVHAAADPIVREKILTMDNQVFRSQFEAGFFGAFNFLQSVAQIMKRQKSGRLIAITSSVIESPTTPARTGAYTVAKIALRGLLRELHRELSPSGILVFAVAPGLMRTGLNSDLPEKFFEIAEEHSDSMTAEEVGRAVVNVCTSTDIPSGTSYQVSSGTISQL